MATNPMLQSVLLFHNQQVTAPYLPALPPSPLVEAAKPVEEKDIPFEEDEEDDEEPETKEENEESENDSDGEKHQQQ